MRVTWIKLHLITAAFFSLALLLMATSGGAYLLGYKGDTQATGIAADGLYLDFGSDSLEADIRQVLSELGIDHDFEYVRAGGNSAVTRPTSRTYYEFRASGAGIKVTRNEPNFLAALVELHKGHGPEAFKTFQMVMAPGLVFVLLTGLWLGVSSKKLRTMAATSAGVGVLVFIALAFVL